MQLNIIIRKPYGVKWPACNSGKFTMYSVFTFSENQNLIQIAMLTTAAEEPRTQFKTLNITVPNPFVYHVELNRPKKLNAMNNTMWL